MIQKDLYPPCGHKTSLVSVVWDDGTMTRRCTTCRCLYTVLTAAWWKAMWGRLP